MYCTQNRKPSGTHNKIFGKGLSDNDKLKNSLPELIEELSEIAHVTEKTIENTINEFIEHSFSKFDGFFRGFEKSEDGTFSETEQKFEEVIEIFSHCSFISKISIEKLVNMVDTYQDKYDKKHKLFHNDVKQPLHIKKDTPGRILQSPLFIYPESLYPTIPNKLKTVYHKFNKKDEYLKGDLYTFKQIDKELSPIYEEIEYTTEEQKKPYYTNHTKGKPIYCMFDAKGECLKGDSCTYAHNKPPFEKFKTKPCKFEKNGNGRCTKGDSCTFSHTEIDKEPRTMFLYQ